MYVDQNYLNGQWLCWIPETPVAVYYSSKKPAYDLMVKVNEGLSDGKLFIDRTTGNLKRNPDI